ncbi:nucleoside triphosphate pyrophosphohydrolase [Hyphobacterium sp. SN044]|uniref:nucleoside triphosphate pyrophosphohydrolase n=1 Tax=Hyphobacterium sp. SN044 TaxID=2912575 RepID=UPI001F3F9762|nr:nucleoside triphosphate pyrophosphohydrolase [Hyphobacterium sp. SN044]MCF8879065.1 nucleoside triphosphate pyrophosphohydrolase [Hyphobacterium sp. SN044]
MFKTTDLALTDLLAVMAKLRDPETGCPWDVEQTFETIAPYTIEEAYEVEDAIRRGDPAEIKDELGDLLLQVVFHARMAEEAGLFDFNDVAASIRDKMIRRHPHVFGDASYANSAEQTQAWEEIKAAERKDSKGSDGLLDDVPLGLPALKRAQKLQKRAATIGFDWPDAERVWDKVEEELAEVREAAASGDTEKTAEEIGDLLFVIVNYARKLKLDAESSARDANAKFERRFRHIEQRLSEAGRKMNETSLDEMEALWVEAKMLER